MNNNTFKKIVDLATIIIELTKSKSKVIKKDLPVDDPMRRKPDISMAKDLIDWEPTTDLKDGLEQTIDYFKSKLK